MPTAVSEAVAASLVEFASVYTANYDLLVYGAVVEGGLLNRFQDYFWNTDLVFGPHRTSSTRTRIHYLHGALHLATDRWGEVRKLRANMASNILQQFRSLRPQEGTTLFVSEAASAQKLASVRASSYLRLRLDRLEQDQDDIVIFGQSLSDADRHVLDAVYAGPRRAIAISVHRATEDGRQLDELVGKLAAHDVPFFYADKHPLGLRSLNCDLDVIVRNN